MNHGSLFSGIGGFDLAAEWMGWNNVFHCEKAEYQREVLKKRFPKSISLEDVRDINESNVTQEMFGLHVLSGGFPCVDITGAKNAVEKPKGIHGDESKLWFEYKRICSLLRPKYPVVENSANLNLRGLYAVTGGFAEIGYDCIWFNVSASRVGAPHRRTRTIIVAYTNEQRLEGNVGKKLAGEIQRRFDSNVARSTWWNTEPGLDRLANGLPARVEYKRQRLEAGGNAIVPYVALEIFKAIETVELKIKL